MTKTMTITSEIGSREINKEQAKDGNCNNCNGVVPD